MIFGRTIKDDTKSWSYGQSFIYDYHLFVPWECTPDIQIPNVLWPEDLWKRYTDYNRIEKSISHLQEPKGT